MNCIESCGIEPNHIARLASKVKTTLDLDIDLLNDYFGYVYGSAVLSFDRFGIKDDFPPLYRLDTNYDLVCLRGIPTLSEEQRRIIPEGFISSKPLIKVLVLRDIIRTVDDPTIRDFLTISLAKLIVKKAGNIGFGPEIYKTKPKDDINALAYFASNTSSMIQDVEAMHNDSVHSTILDGDARHVDKYLDASYLKRIKSVITSPPYPNEKDYTRSTRLESVLLGLINDRKELRNLKEDLLRSNSRNVFVNDSDGDYIRQFERIESLANEVENKRISKNKNSGFEKMYHKIVRHYFGGMFLHLQSLKPYLAEEAKLAYVVGDQMSYFQTPIPTAELLSDIAEALGYVVKGIELWRTRLSTATKLQLNENVLILENS